MFQYVGNPAEFDTMKIGIIFLGALVDVKRVSVCQSTYNLYIYK